jgi:hypothetical protein
MSNKNNIWSIEACVGCAVVAVIVGAIVLMVAFCSCNENKPCPDPQGQTKVTTVDLKPVQSEIHEVKVALAVMDMTQTKTAAYIVDKIVSLDSNMQKQHNAESDGFNLGVILLIILGSVMTLCAIFAMLALFRKEPIIGNPPMLLAELSIIEKEVVDRLLAMHEAYVVVVDKKRKIEASLSKADRNDQILTGSLVALDQVYETSVDAYIMANDKLCRFILSSSYLTRTMRNRYERQIDKLIEEYPDKAAGIVTPYTSILKLKRNWRGF